MIHSRGQSHGLCRGLELLFATVFLVFVSLSGNVHDNPGRCSESTSALRQSHILSGIAISTSSYNQYPFAHLSHNAGRVHHGIALDNNNFDLVTGEVDYLVVLMLPSH